MTTKLEKAAATIDRITMSTEREAKERLERIQSKARFMEVAWLSIGREADEALKMQDPQVLGMNAKQWMEKAMLGKGISTIYRALKNVKALCGIVPDEVLAQMSEGNANYLAQLPEKDRKDEEWIKKALTTSNSEFKYQVQESLGKKGPQHVAKYVELLPRLPFEMLQMVDEVTAKIAVKQGLDIETHPGLKSVVWERIVAMLFNTDVEIIVAEMEGGEPQKEN